MGVSRDQLYHEVWAEPMTKVAARYGVSSSFLARVCEHLDVPRPARGYWVQLQVGKAQPRPVLPEPRPGAAIEWSREGAPLRAPRAPPQAPAAGRRVPRRPRGFRPSSHQLVRQGREHFDAAKELDSGYLRPAKKRLVDVFVTKSSLDRALDAATKLFLALEERGHRVTFAGYNDHLSRHEIDERIDPGRTRFGHTTWRPDRPTLSYVGTVAIGLTIYELSEYVEVRSVDGKPVRVTDRSIAIARRRRGLTDWTYHRDMPTGRLCLRASSPYMHAQWERQWREEKVGDLAASVPRIVRELESAAPTVADLIAEGERRAEIARKEWEAEQEVWRRQEAERRRIQNTKESRDDLSAIIDCWAVAKQVESFFDDAERRVAALGDGDHATELRERLRRARALVGTTDALDRFRLWKAPDER